MASPIVSKRLIYIHLKSWQSNMSDAKSVIILNEDTFTQIYLVQE